MRVSILSLTTLLLASAMPMFSQGKPVTLVFSATDKNGLPAAELKNTDVKVSEGGKDQAVSSVQKIADLPLTIAFLIDGSVGTAAVPTYWQAEAAKFLTSLLRPKMDKAGILHYRGNLTRTQDMTDDLAALSTALNTNTPTGGAFLYEAVIAAADSLAKVEGRRALVLISDGQDNGSRSKYESTLEKVRASGAIIYTITVRADRVTSVDNTPETFLRRLADESGGIMYNVTKAQEIQKAFKEIQSALNSEFSVQYQSSGSADGKFHKVRVGVTDKNVQVKHPTGYYAQ